MLRKQHSSIPGKVEVIFELPDTLWADEIFIVGDFNDWDQRATGMHQLRDGRWSRRLVLDEGREYEFLYLVDGRDWMNDPHADAYRPNRYGSSNSVVITVIAEE